MTTEDDKKLLTGQCQTPPHHDCGDTRSGSRMMLRRLICSLSAILGMLLVFDVSAEEPTPLNPAAMKPNVWVQVQAKPTLPDNLKDCHWAPGDGYSNSAYRSKTGGILSRTGIDCGPAGLSPGYYSNTTLEWDLASNNVHVVEVSNWGGGSYGHGKLLPAFKENPTPTPRHTYDGIAYVENKDMLYMMLGANWKIGFNADEDAKTALALDESSTWKYSFANQRWSRIDGNARQLWSNASPYGSHLRYWPSSGKLIFLDASGSLYAEFDLKTEKWTKIELHERSPISLAGARSTWDSKRNLWVFRKGQKACTFDPVARKFKPLPDIYGMADFDKDGLGQGVTYISKHDVYLVTGATGNDTFVYNPTKGTWSNLKGGDIALGRGYLQYDSKTDLVAMVYQLNMFTLRYMPEAAN